MPGPRMINGVSFSWGGFTPAYRPEFADSFVRVNSPTMEGENRMQFHSLKCHRCNGRVEAVVYDDVLTMLIDGAQHQVPVKHVPAYRCLDCQTSWTDGSSDETIHYWWLQYVKANGMYTPWRRFCRWWRKYRDSWYYWHWNRAPWARWTWGDTPVPDRVLSRRWWQWR